MRIDEFDAEFRRLAAEFSREAINSCVPAASPKFLEVFLDRIFIEGLDSEGNKLGTYSTTPGYFDKEKFQDKGKFKGVGKTGDTKFLKGINKGKDHKSMYLKGGYRELRGIQGRETGFVNLNYSNSLFSSIKIYPEKEKVLVAIADAKDSAKRKALEKKYKKTIFRAGDKEIDIYGEALILELQVAKEKIFG